MPEPMLNSAMRKHPDGEVRVYRADGKLVAGTSCAGYLRELAEGPAIKAGDAVRITGVDEDATIDMTGIKATVDTVREDGKWALVKVEGIGCLFMIRTEDLTPITEEQ